MSIHFNGQEFQNVEDMPADLRREYERLAGLIGDANRNGVPDFLENLGIGNITVKLRSSFTVNGQTVDPNKDTPAEVRQGDEARRRGAPRPADPPRCDAREGSRRPMRETLDKADHFLTNGFWAFLVILTGGVVLSGIYLMLAMDAGARSQGGRFYLALGVIFVLGLLESQFARLVRRRSPFLLIPTDACRRYQLRSLLRLGLAAAGFLGFALLFP